MLLVETAGLCLRCSPYVDGGLGIVVLEATSGMNLPRKIGPMLSLADIAVVTKIDRVSQAEREVFRARILEAAPAVRIREVNALYGIGIDPIADAIADNPGGRRRPGAARQSAGRHLHHLRRQEDDRLAVAFRRRSRPGQSDLLPRANRRWTIYLDNAATTPIDPRVAAAMAPWHAEAFGNPSSLHAPGRRRRGRRSRPHAPRSRPCSAPTRAKSSSPPAAPRPTTWP